jgi:hypothetical protein
MGRTDEITIQVSRSELATWSSELALDDRFGVSIEIGESRSRGQTNAMYSLEYTQVAAIAIQAIGALSSLVAIYDKIVDIHEKQKSKKRSVASESENTDPKLEPNAEPVLIISGKRYLLSELPREKILELDKTP